MRNYKQVVQNRYDKLEYSGNAIKENIYSMINPIGFYGEVKKWGILQEFVQMLDKQSGGQIEKLKICDCGCGEGIQTRMLAEFLMDPTRIYGIEYSKGSLEHCRQMNPLINYAFADLTDNNKIPFDTLFDGIVSFVVFMHFSSKNEIGNAFKKIKEALKPGGLFLWYDLNAKSHWKVENKNADGWGFSPQEMDSYAQEAGFKLVRSYGIYCILPFLNISTYYLADRIKNLWFLEALGYLPFKDAYNIRIYQK